MAGATIQVSFEMLGEFQGFEGREVLDTLRCVLGCVEALACIVFSEPVLQISRMATIELCCMSSALEDIRIKHGFSFRLSARSWKVRKSRKAVAGLPSVARNRGT